MSIPADQERRGICRFMDAESRLAFTPSTDLRANKSLDTGLVSGSLPLVSTYRERQLDALGDPTRRAILARLRRGPAPVGKLARDFPVSRPAISQHLRVLKEANFVTDRADGTKRVYELNPDAFASLREYFDEFWGVALIAFKKRVDHRTREER